MPLPLDRDQTQQLCEELETVIAAHLAWFKQLNRVLVCGSPAEASAACVATCHHSPFGLWYYSRAPHPLADQPDFQAMGTVQQSLHAAAREVLEEIADGRRPRQELHDRFLDLALKLNNQLRHLQLEIIGDLLATDSLTGCYTRRGMIGRLQAEQERAVRIQRPCCLCLMDFDHFKQVNDRLGHPAGDAVLKQGMRFVSSVLRKYDTVFRYGGEEFLLCLPGTPLADAHLVVERIRTGLAALPILLPGGRPHRVTASFGLAELRLGKPVEDSIEQADQGLLQAKNSGRNRVEVMATAAAAPPVVTP